MTYYREIDAHTAEIDRSMAEWVVTTLCGMIVDKQQLLLYYDHATV